MKNKVYIGIDNGVTGTVGIISDEGSVFFKTPVKTQQNYTKAKANITRIDSVKFRNSLVEGIGSINSDLKDVFCVIERPMVNPTRFVATTSALRALEAILCVIEELEIPYQYEDSKAWQKLLLPSGSQKDDLKKDSETIGIRLFPKHKELILKHKDADGLLLAEYAKRKNL